MTKIKNKWFTLIELIIVVTVLAILTTIAFISFQSYIKDARNSNRLSTIKNIETWLELYNLKTSSYPKPDNDFEITASWKTIWFQWYFWDIATRSINMTWIPLDPKTKEKYVYQTNKNNKSYQVMTFIEKKYDAHIFSTQNDLYPFTSWKDLWIILTQDNKIVENDAWVLDLMNFWSWINYRVYLWNTIVEWIWLDIFWWLDMLGEKNWSLSAPSNCKDWFIPVSWNPEFLQPWFCVMKYEANHKTIDSNPDSSCTSWSETWECNIAGSSLISSDISSRTGALPINKLSQQKSIELCMWLWPKHHLVTNNEWMTIARQIEQNSINWSNWQVWSWWVYRWNVINTTWTDDDLSCWAGIASLTDFTSEDSFNLTNTRNTCDEKRQLVLSNWEIIWDFSGNLWEHVNKANTMDGRLFDFWLTSFVDNVSWDWDWWYPTWYNNSNLHDNIRKIYWPIHSTYWNSHGMWNIRWWLWATSNVFVRWEWGWWLNQWWIYALWLLWDNLWSNDASFWFRCAY